MGWLRNEVADGYRRESHHGVLEPHAWLHASDLCQRVPPYGDLGFI